MVFRISEELDALCWVISINGRIQGKISLLLQVLQFPAVSVLPGQDMDKAAHLIVKLLHVPGYILPGLNPYHKLFIGQFPVVRPYFI